MFVKQNQMNGIENTDKQWKSIYLFGCITTLFIVIGSLLDIIIGFTLGGDLSVIPQTAIDRFSEFQSSWLLGLYHLDMLNLLTTILMIPTYFALYAAHRRTNIAYVKLAIVIFIIGAAVFITNNTALPMFTLSKNYFSAATETHKTLLAAAGESMLARGAHGSPGAFLGFVLSSVASIMLSYGLLKGRIFSKASAYVGISGGLLLLAYLILVTFVPDIKTIAMMLATPGGLLSMAWLIMIAIKLYKLWRYGDAAQPQLSQTTC